MNRSSIHVHTLCLDKEGFFLDSDEGVIEEKDFNEFMKKLEELLRKRWEVPKD